MSDSRDDLKLQVSRLETEVRILRMEMDRLWNYVKTESMRPPFFPNIPSPDIPPPPMLNKDKSHKSNVFRFDSEDLNNHHC